MSTTRPTATVQIDFSSDLAAGLAYYERVASDGPYLWYRLKETSGTAAADASGNGITGTLSGSYTLNQTSGKPVTGETASRYVTIGSGGRVSYSSAAFEGVTKITLEAWVYRDSLNGSPSTFYVIGEADATNGADDWMSFSVTGDGKLRMQSGYTNAITTTAPMTAATWQHIACAMDIENDTITFYRNGVALTTDYGPIESGRVGFQRSGLGDYNWFWGATSGTNTISRIAEPALYTYALAPSQVLDHYNAAATVPFAGFSWTTVNAYLDDREPLARKFGRESNTSGVTPMELSFRLWNRDRRFEIDNPASPYYPYVVPGRPVRVQMVQDGVTYDWAFGYIQDFAQDYSDDLFGTVPIVANCFLEKMNQAEFDSRVFQEQLAGTRIGQVLNFVGQPQSMRTLDAGANQIMGQATTSGSPGEHGQQVARSDRGMFFFDGAGYAIFQDGNYRTSNARATTSQGTLGPAEINYRRPQFHSPKSLIRNVIRLRRPGGVEQVAIDAPSKHKYGEITHSDELLLANDSTLASRAADLLADYKEPTLRVRSVEFDPQATVSGNWTDALGVKLSDRYTWQFDPMQGSTLTRAVHVEGVNDTYDFRSGEYSAHWVLSLATEGAQIALPSVAIAVASAPAPTTIGGSSGNVTVTVDAALAVGSAPAPTVIGGDVSTVRLGVTVQGGSNTNGVVKAAPATYTTHVPKLPVPAVYVFVFSAPPIYNAIVAGSTNQDYRMQPPQQPVTDPRQTTSRIQQR
jgi:hypothetical protein